MYEVFYQVLMMAVSAVIITAVWWGTLRLMDRAAGIDFRDELEQISQDNMALSLYMVGRLIALAILFAPLLRVVF